MIHNFKDWNKLNENKINFNNKIDYTYLKDNTTIDTIKQLCKEAEENNYYSICVKPENVSTAKAFLNNDVKICTVISFPNGTDKTNNKIKIIDNAIINGVDEIDMVMNYKKVKKLSYLEGEQYDNLKKKLLDDVRNVTKICHSNGIIIKVIIEVEDLNYNQIKIATEICVNAGVDYIQTSTGYISSMDTLNDKLDKIKYIRKLLPDYINIKISGGIRNMEQIEQILPYVDRIGTSSIIK